ncbi:glycosyltransferase [Leuconostoc sp. LN180020]|uniref:glycosyltransferase n=1 Tax=Leuconostoc sp. LN180020 TaxID=2571156 RepID=UPI00177ABB72|nr:glycosyltransferase [Leuconostoc sp. LN180020]QOG10372.1 glycosyltransferase [Leuconostoc sp. LN180020]
MKVSLIISFNSEISLLIENINILSKVMDKIVIVDNNSVNKKDLIEIENSYSKVKIIFLESNFGIAKATNVGFDYLSEISDWILVLDQDSILDIKDIDVLYSFVDRDNFNSLGMITPRYLERNELHDHFGDENISEWQFVDYPIASGSLVSVKAWKFVGGYDDDLFIDRVDDDFDLRIRNVGYLIIQANHATINHAIGQIKVVHFFNKNIKVYNHNAFRKYYQSRNNIIFAKKHGGLLKAWVRNIVLLCKTVLFEQEKMTKFKSIFKGIKDGIKYSM